MTERDNRPSTRFASRTNERGSALGALLHAFLLLLVLAQVVYLASRYRARVDLTSDQLWTSTESTQRVLDKLDKRLVVEAYFSPKAQLPVQNRTYRAWADNFLDELVQRGDGRIVVQRFDPNSDKGIADKATRLGIEPLSLQSRSATSLSIDQHWQGLRLVYGGGRQEVIPSFVPGSSFLAEALLTPKIKEVLTDEKRKFGYIEWPAQLVGGRQPGGVGWSFVRTQENIKKRYEFQNLKDEDGALLPADVDTLFLFRPKELSDRQKYVIDQFLMGGGTLVLFADAAEYAIGPQRLMTRMPLSIDQKGSAVSFADQLRHYGIDWQQKLVCDMAQQAYGTRMGQAVEYFAVPVAQRSGQNRYQGVGYPYFFHAVAADWSTVADQLAKDRDGNVDARKADQYRALLKPGMPSDDFLFQAFKLLGRSPGFYWPTSVGLRTRTGGALDLPDGVEGRVLLRSSPLALLEDPPQSVNPIGRDPRQQRVQYETFLRKLQDRLRAEARVQVPLMVEVNGPLTSFFATRERPLRPSQAKAKEAREAREGDGPQQANPDEPGKIESGGEGAEEAAPEEFGPPAPTASSPQAASESADASPQERATLTEAASPARIVVVGDATFLRDDVVRGAYQQQGGPVSGGRAVPFFLQLLDWLNEDRDLVELQSRVATDRSMTLVDPEARSGRDPREYEQRLRSKTGWLVFGNVLVPVLVLLAFGLLVFAVRRSQKRAFLSSLS
ncbi:MAG: GldG family protein [Planctomycetota bacterium]